MLLLIKVPWIPSMSSVIPNKFVSIKTLFLAKGNTIFPLILYSNTLSGYCLIISHHSNFYKKNFFLFFSKLLPLTIIFPLNSPPFSWNSDHISVCLLMYTYMLLISLSSSFSTQLRLTIWYTLLFHISVHRNLTCYTKEKGFEKKVLSILVEGLNVVGMGKGEIKDFPQASQLKISVDDTAIYWGEVWGTVSRLKGWVTVVLSLYILRHPSWDIK